jgi:hypothetical protein
MKTLCHSKMKEGAVRRCFYFDLRLISSTSSVARASFKQLSRGSHSSADLQSLQCVRAGRGSMDYPLVRRAAT